MENRGLKYGYRSGLEDKIALQLKEKGIFVAYETMKVNYVQPAKNRYYTPDFLLPNGIIIETKGRFISSDRYKHLWIRDCNPSLDIRFVFSNFNTKIYKGSKTTYGMWCDKNGFKYADKKIPEEWFNEKAKQ